VKKIVRDQLRQRQRRLHRRLSRRTTREAARGRVRMEMSGRARGTGSAGLHLANQLTKTIGLREEINDHVELLQAHRPYTEADHVLAMAFNVMAGGDCIEDLEHRRCDEALLDLLGVERLPDPTTAGDFCRRFGGRPAIDGLHRAINEARLTVWGRQPDEFFEHAIIDADGSIAETTGSCKEGMDLTFKKTWGYQALQITLANTQEVLFQDLRPGSRPASEGAADRLDEAVHLLRRGGFRSVTMRGDTEFSQSRYLDEWHENEDIDTRFIFGCRAIEKLQNAAGALPEASWRLLERKPRRAAASKPRARPANVKSEIVAERELYNLCLAEERVAEFEYRPSACKRPYRMIALRKIVNHERGQNLLFAQTRYLFYITNRRDLTAEQVVELANQRCEQERTICQLKDSGVGALSMPLGDLHANWAYMVIATLAWNLSRWIALVLPVTGRWRRKHEEQKERVLRMRFRTFCQAFMSVTAHVVQTSRQIVVRITDWNSHRDLFFRALDALTSPT